MDSKFAVRRFIAFVIDWNIMGVIPYILVFFGPGANPEWFILPSAKMFTTPAFLIAIVWFGVFCLFRDCLFGRKSLGKLICGLTIVNSETGEKPSYESLIMRNFTFLFAQIEGIVVLINKGIRIGDTIAKTKVIIRKKAD